MNLTVNGQPQTLAGAPTLAELLAQLAIPADRVAIEHNRVIVTREQFATTPLGEGDTVEIVRFVGGG